jgi:hypothetical protein
MRAQRNTANEYNLSSEFSNCRLFRAVIPVNDGLRASLFIQPDIAVSIFYRPRLRNARLTLS